MENDYKYEVCFSYAKKQIEYVKQVYNVLKKHNVRVFFDKAEDIEPDIWGNDLVEIFDEIYNRDSRYCMIFISKEYKESKWATAEVRNALGRFIKESNKYLLPVIFDDVHIPGIPDTLHHFDAREIGPEEVGENFLKLIKQELVNHCDMNKVYTDLTAIYPDTVHFENQIIVYDSCKKPLCVISLENDMYYIYDICLFFTSQLEYSLTEEELTKCIQSIAGSTALC